ncbi:MAG: DUF6930 domain-containing protein [Ruminococcus sp.]
MRIKKNNISYVISVSVGTGCYRHIRISGDRTLDDFAGCILDSFDFDFDHLYSFYMDNKWWSHVNCYNHPYSEEPPFADRVILAQLGLQKGTAFKFLFDFGDEWRFQCKVLRVLDEDTPEELIVRSVGKSPEQYPDYEDFDDFLDFDDFEEFNDNEPDTNEEDSELMSDDDFAPEIPPLSIPDDVMEAAYQFRSDKLWKKLNENEIFAVRLSNGETGYCSVMGSLGKFTALTLYIGQEGWNSLVKALQCNTDEINDLKSFDFLLSQNCLQTKLSNKSEVPDALIKPVRDYADKHGINLKGHKSYPAFCKFKTYIFPDFITQQDDFTFMLEALKASHEVAQELNKSNKVQLSLDSSIDTIPLLTPDGDKFSWSLKKYPEAVPETFPQPKLNNDVLTGRIKQLPQQGTWECKCCIFSQPVFDINLKKAVYSSFIVAADTDNGNDFSIDNTGYFPSTAEKMLSEFASAVLEHGSYPCKILTEGKRSMAFFGDFCEKFGIELIEAEKFSVLYDLIDKYIHNPKEPLNIERFLKMIEELDSMSEHELTELPKMIQEFLCNMIGSGILPPQLEKKLKKLDK